MTRTMKKWLILIAACVIMMFGSASFSSHVYAGQNAIGSAQDGKTFKLKKGQTKKLSITIGGFKYKSSSLKFTSSNKKVATVSKTGKVKACKKGTAIITYYDQDYPWAKFKCKIKVVKK